MPELTPNPVQIPFHITVVDDDLSVRNALRRLIQSAGYTAAIFPNAMEFLQSPAFKETSCLILDVQMPGLDGLGLLSVVRALKSQVAAIIITAHPDESIRARAAAMNVVGFLEKPFDDQALIAIIQKAQQIHGAPQTPPVQKSTV